MPLRKVTPVIDYIHEAFCPIVMVVYVLIGAWLVRLSVENKQQLLFLVGLWAWIDAAQILVSYIPSKFVQLPYIGSDFVGSQPTADTLVYCLPFGATVCIGWAAVLALQGKFLIKAPGSFVDWIAGSAAIVALVLPAEARPFCKELDTATSVVAVVLMSIALTFSWKFTSRTLYFSLLRWTGAALWFIHALVDSFWYIADNHLVMLSRGVTLLINVIGTLPTIAAVVITGVIFQNAALSGRRRPRSQSVAH
jgi:hypothetical protein